MKRFIVFCAFEIVILIFWVLGCALFFGANNNSGNILLSKIYGHYHDVQSFMVNKLPFLQLNIELFGMVFFLFGLITMIGAFSYFKKI
jgi:hypothetical protein